MTLSETVSKQLGKRAQELMKGAEQQLKTTEAPIGRLARAETPLEFAAQAPGIGGLSLPAGITKYAPWLNGFVFGSLGGIIIGEIRDKWNRFMQTAEARYQAFLALYVDAPNEEIALDNLRQAESNMLDFGLNFNQRRLLIEGAQRDRQVQINRLAAITGITPAAPTIQEQVRLKGEQAKLMEERQKEALQAEEKTKKEREEEVTATREERERIFRETQPLSMKADFFKQKGIFSQADAVKFGFGDEFKHFQAELSAAPKVEKLKSAFQKASPKQQKIEVPTTTPSRGDIFALPSPFELLQPLKPTPEQQLAIEQGIMVPGLPGEKFIKKRKKGWEV